MKVLVLGAYGLIGSAVTSALLQRGDAVAGLARSGARGKRRFPAVDWIEADLADLRTPADWLPLLADIDAVVNASGALQSGPGVDLARVQGESIVALVAACTQAGVKKFVQISAPGAETGATTQFMATKGVADNVLRQSGLDWVILRPGLVLAQDAYGGTSLLRMAAGFPLVQPLFFAEARVQTVDVADVAAAVLQGLDEPNLARQSFDLVEAESHSLGEVILAFRAFLGFPKPLAVWTLPGFLAGWAGGLADAAAWLGWHSALRSTALTVLVDGVRGEPAPWIAAGGTPPRSMAETLFRLAGTAQDRIFARTRLIFPVALMVLALFWIASGLIGLLRIDAATALIAGELGDSMARLLVVLGSLADVLIGSALLVRRWTHPACIAAVLVSLAYLVAGTVLTPELWADPLGPLVKILPGLVLAPAIMAMRTDR